MVATLNIILPLISQGVISSLGFGISLVIDVVMSLVYQALTVLGCGGCGCGGGTIGAVGGGGIVGAIAGTIWGFISIICGGGGIVGGGIIVGIIEEAVGALASAYNTLCQAFS